MTKLYVIAGHGGGDSGACGNGYEEHERVVALAQEIVARGGGEVDHWPYDQDCYGSRGMDWINPGCPVLELHMDSAGPGARGGHVIIPSNYGGADVYDNAIADLMAELFPGRSNLIVERDNLRNPNVARQRGINYRLVENGFISDAGDVATFNANIGYLADRYLAIFGITSGGGSDPAPAPTPAPAPQPSGDIDDLARRVINGEFGNGDARRAALGDLYGAVQARVNEMLGYGGGSPAPSPAPAVDIDDLARRVINGEFGNGDARKAALGSKYDAVQARVNEMLGYGGGGGSQSVDIDALAWKVINGDYGNGQARKNALGDLYDRVQARVNELL